MDASTLVFAVLAASAIGAVVYGAHVARFVFVGEVRNGVLAVTRGGVTPSVLSDLRDVVARPPATRARIRIVRERGLARIVATGDLTPEQLQRLRNVVGTVPLARLAASGARRR